MARTYTAIPKTQIVSITVEENGEKVSKDFIGYVRGPGCPVPIIIEVDQLQVDYEDNFPTDEERNKITAIQYLHKARRAEYILRRDLLCTVIPGLPVEMADVLASDDDGGAEILSDLGWYVKVTSPEGEGVRVDSDETGE